MYSATTSFWAGVKFCNSGVTTGMNAVPLVSIRYTRRMLLCPVRDCHLALAREERRVVCAKGHSFDVARSGYINLLQPQDRRSRNPGDTAAAVDARRRLHDRGVTEPLLRAVQETMGVSAAD